LAQEKITMSNGPKNTEEKLRKMINSWEQDAPTKKFAVTLDEFKAGLKPSFDARELIADLEINWPKPKTIATSSTMRPWHWLSGS
jgi:hypothetical protein